jgi:hypothetical protein
MLFKFLIFSEIPIMTFPGKHCLSIFSSEIFLEKGGSTDFWCEKSLEKGGSTNFWCEKSLEKGGSTDFWCEKLLEKGVSSNFWTKIGMSRMSRIDFFSIYATILSQCDLKYFGGYYEREEFQQKTLD